MNPAFSQPQVSSPLPSISLPKSVIISSVPAETQQYLWKERRPHTRVQQLWLTLLLCSPCTLVLVEFGTRPGTNINIKLKVFLQKKGIGNVSSYCMNRLRLFSHSHQSWWQNYIWLLSFWHQGGRDKGGKSVLCNPGIKEEKTILPNQGIRGAFSFKFPVIWSLTFPPDARWKLGRMHYLILNRRL